MGYQFARELIAELVPQIKAAGFRVFVAERGTYGFYTDAAGSKVVCFQVGLGGLEFSGNYKTSAPSSTGTGWRLLTQPPAEMFKQGPPQWALHGATWEYTTLEQHLKTYQASSKYTEV